MLKGLKTLLGLGGNFLGLHRSWLTLIAVAIAAAFFYAQSAMLRADRNRFSAWVDVVCASAGTAYKPDKATAAPGTDLRPGIACKAEIAGLAAFRTAAANATATALAVAADDHDRRLKDDTAAIRRNADAMRNAANDLEKANAAQKDDRVDDMWFGAFNRAAGLRNAGH